jgi:invasion protein IalB
MKRVIFFLALLAAANVFASQQKVSISRGFFNGRDYFEMSDTEKRAYAVGAVNGMLVAPFFGAPEERLAWFKKCTAKLSDEQTAAILTQYLSSNSDQLGMSLNVVTFNALKDACDKLKQ